jgi:ATP-dependent Clp protease ATP-binding subunit ClpA
VTDSARKRLAEEGYDPQFGARPLKRAIQDLLLNPLAQRLLAGDFKPRDMVGVSADASGNLNFTVAEADQA